MPENPSMGLIVAINTCKDVTTIGRFGNAVDPVGWVTQLQAHLEAMIPKYDRDVTAEAFLVRELGEQIGYENMMRLTRDEWRNSLAEGSVHENWSLETCLTGDAQLRVDLARALHRRHEIDRVEYKRMKTPDEFKFHTIDDTHSRVDRELELTENQITTSWAAEGSNRTYWNLLAGEALRFLRQQPPTALPAPLRCLQCRGHGTVLVRLPDVPSGTAKIRNELTRETCALCDGTGIPPETK